MTGLKSVSFRLLIVPFVVLMIVCVLVSSWKVYEPMFEEGFDAAAPITADMSVLAAGGGSTAIDVPVIPPLPSPPKPVQLGPPAGVMQVPADTKIPVIVPDTSPVQPFPSLTGNALTSVTNATSTVPQVANSVPPIPPAMPTDNTVANLTPGMSVIGAKMVTAPGNITGLSPPMQLDAKMPQVPSTYQNPGMPAALTAQQQMPMVKPFADEAAAAFDAQRYTQLFEELGTVQRQISDDVIRLQAVSNRIKNQWVPNYPLPVMTINAGY